MGTKHEQSDASMRKGLYFLSENQYSLVPGIWWKERTESLMLYIIFTYTLWHIQSCTATCPHSCSHVLAHKCTHTHTHTPRIQYHCFILLSYCSYKPPQGVRSRFCPPTVKPLEWETCLGGRPIA